MVYTAQRPQHAYLFRNLLQRARNFCGRPQRRPAVGRRRGADGWATSVRRSPCGQPTRRRATPGCPIRADVSFERPPKTTSRTQPDDSTGSVWPSCPECRTRRQASCPICKTAGTDFPSGRSHRHRRVATTPRRCCCARFATSRSRRVFCRDCAACGHEFGEGTDRAVKPRGCRPAQSGARLVLAGMIRCWPPCSAGLRTFAAENGRIIAAPP